MKYYYRVIEPWSTLGMRRAIIGSVFTDGTNAAYKKIKSRHPGTTLTDFSQLPIAKFEQLTQYEIKTTNADSSNASIDGHTERTIVRFFTEDRTPDRHPDRGDYSPVDSNDLSYPGSPIWGRKSASRHPHRQERRR